MMKDDHVGDDDWMWMMMTSTSDGRVDTAGAVTTAKVTTGPGLA